MERPDPGAERPLGAAASLASAAPCPAAVAAAGAPAAAGPASARPSSASFSSSVSPAAAAPALPGVPPGTSSALPAHCTSCRAASACSCSSRARRLSSSRAPRSTLSAWRRTSSGLRASLQRWRTRAKLIAVERRWLPDAAQPRKQAGKVGGPELRTAPCEVALLQSAEPPAASPRLPAHTHGLLAPCAADRKMDTIWSTLSTAATASGVLRRRRRGAAQHQHACRCQQRRGRASMQARWRWAAR